MKLGHLVELLDSFELSKANAFIDDKPIKNIAVSIHDGKNAIIVE